MSQPESIRAIDFRNIEEKIDFSDPEIIALQEALAEFRLEHMETDRQETDDQ